MSSVSVDGAVLAGGPWRVVTVRPKGLAFTQLRVRGLPMWRSELFHLPARLLGRTPLEVLNSSSI